MSDDLPIRSRGSRAAVPVETDETLSGEPLAVTPVAEWAEASAEAPDSSPAENRAADQMYEVEVDIRSRAARSAPAEQALGDIAAGTLKLVGDNLRRMSEEQIARIMPLLQQVDVRDYLDPAFWQGIGMVVKYQVDEIVQLVQRRQRGEYTTDEFGMDRDIVELARPFMTFLYRTWWRTEVSGLEHVPASGRALLTSNHSGVLPWDGAMIAAAVMEDHPAQNQRVVRNLHLHWFTTLPFVAPTLAALGHVPGVPANGVRLLEKDELVCVFPEGLKGVGKLYSERYKLARFGRGGFVQAALRAQAPIVPVAVVGAEEIYPMLANAEPVARALGMPFFPLTPFFPWLGPLGVVPLPTRWSITFCPPIANDDGPDLADDPLTVLGRSEQVREIIQAAINARLATRTSVF